MNPTTKNVRYMLKESNAIEGVFGRYPLVQAGRAWRYAMNFDKITPEIIKEIHRIMMIGLPLEPRHRGAWRDIPVYIGGEKKSQPPLVIQRQIEEWCEKTNTVDRNFDPVTLHIAFEEIHPFVDGNGRVGRLLLNWHLVKRNNAPLLVYTHTDRKTYYRLFASYRAKEMGMMIEMMRGLL